MVGFDLKMVGLSQKAPFVDSNSSQREQTDPGLHRYVGQTGTPQLASQEEAGRAPGGNKSLKREASRQTSQHGTV